jgi:hypothetical protein
MSNGTNADVRIENHVPSPVRGMRAKPRIEMRLPLAGDSVVPQEYEVHNGT